MTERHCPECGRTVDHDARFCSGCGTALGQTDKSTQRTSGRASLEEMFVHLRSGEERPATVLMTDVTGFSTLSSGAEPDWIFNLINEVLAELVECLTGYGAHIDNYVGDEVVALFGVTVAQERSTSGTCHARPHSRAECRGSLRRYRAEDSHGHQLRPGHGRSHR